MNLMTVADVRDGFRFLWEAKVFVPDKSGKNTIEMLGAQFLADDSTIFGRPNEDYIRRELSWYLNQSLNVNDIEPPVPRIWQEVADKDGFINSNYGNLIFSAGRGHQYQNVVNELAKNKWSRRAVMIYTRPSMWAEFDKNGMSDFICTNVVQYFIRQNPTDKSFRLFAKVDMRSNDAVFGYRNDWAWQRFVFEKLYNELLETYPELKRGNIIWNVGSLHIYEEHFYLIQHYAHTGHFTKG